MKKHRRYRVVVRLKHADRDQLQRLLKSGHDEVRHIRRAITLLQMDQGKSAVEAAKIACVTSKTARSTADRYNSGGLSRALEDDPRPGMKPLLNEKEANQIIAMVCSSPPEGLARWSIRVIAEEAVKRKIVSKISKETIRVLLQSHDLKPWLKKNVVYPGGRFRILGENGGSSKPLQKAS